MFIGFLLSSSISTKDLKSMAEFYLQQGVEYVDSRLEIDEEFNCSSIRFHPVSEKSDVQITKNEIQKMINSQLKNKEA
jgi:hypothetical protein